MEPSDAWTTGKTTPCSTMMMTISRIANGGKDAESREFTIEPSGISEQAQSAYPHDTSDIVLS